MLTLRTRQAPQPHSNDEPTKTQKNETTSDYEQTREERIKQNLEKMQKLGIFDLSLKLKSTIHQNRTPKTQSRIKTPPATPPLQSSGPIRRSSRLKNSTRVSYSEVDLKKDKALEDILPEVGSRVEKYSEEHEKLLGSTEKSWTLFVDGYGKDGKRIYDPVRGKTCHQCRQKTLGHRTHCSKCNMVQGQFCGDCLYMRYGEHVLEATQNPNWICPVCRGICNCSLCRQAKGWAPTGTLYRKISQMGFKSVAHYLIQTCRSETKGNNQDATSEVTVKRSLPFSDIDAVPDDSLKVPNDRHELSEEFKDKSNDEFKNSDDYQNSAERSLPFCNMGLASENIGSLEVDSKVGDHTGSSNHLCPNKRDDNIGSEKEKEMHEIECSNSNTALKSSSNLHMETAQAVELSIEHIAGKLRQRCEKSDNHDADLPEAEDKVLDGKQAVEEISLKNDADQENGFHFTCDKHEGIKKTPFEGTTMVKETSPATTINSDSIAGRLKRRHMKDCDHGNEKNSDVKQAVEGVSLENEAEKQKEVLTSDITHNGDNNTPMETSPKLKQKRVLAAGPSPDSIAGRLRQKRRMGHSQDDEKLGVLEEKSDTLKAADHLSESTSSEPIAESIGERLRSRRRSI